MKPLLICDCDPGTDDAVALYLLAQVGISPDICISTYGNAPLFVTNRNLQLLVQHFHLTSQVAIGQSTPLNEALPSCGNFHGKDALAGLAEPLSQIYPTPQTNLHLDDVANAILTHSYVTYIVTGPLTTLATLIASYPAIVAHISEVLIMGGGLQHFNMPHQTEYNFYGDPLALKQLLHSHLSLTLFPLDFTRQHALLSEKQINLLKLKAHLPAEIVTLISHLFTSCTHLEDAAGAIIHDAMPVLYYLHPESFTIQSLTIQSDLHGHIYPSPQGKTVKIATNLPKYYFYHTFQKQQSTP